MISIKLQTSKNATVSAYRELYNTGYYANREQMLTALCEELLDQVTAHEEQKAFSVSAKLSDLGQAFSGAFVLHVPIQYMAENAKPKEVAVYNLLKEQLVKITKGESEGMILPALTDQSGNRMFTLSYVGPDV